jgi:hypothetical protein
MIAGAARDQSDTLLRSALTSGKGPNVVLPHRGAQWTIWTDALLPLTDITTGFAGMDAFRPMERR